MMVELLSPRADGGVLVQVVVAVVFFTGLGLAARRNRDMVVFVSGLATITADWFALRTVH